MGFLLPELCDFLFFGAFSLFTLELDVERLVLEALMDICDPLRALVLFNDSDALTFLGLVHVPGLLTILPLRMPDVQR
jgi:hypothetical protein